MTGHGEKLSRKQEKLIAALLAEPTAERAATAAGVTSATVRNWMRRSSFRKAYRDARRQLLESVVAMLNRAGNVAVGALIRNLKGNNKATVNRAASIILDNLFRGNDLLDLSERVAALEEKQCP